jgi:hypothetical protein
MPLKPPPAAISPDHEARARAQDLGPAVFARLEELLASADERLALAAGQEILNRAYGKPEAPAAAGAAGRSVVVIRSGAKAGRKTVRRP